MSTPNYWIGNVDAVAHVFSIVFANAATGAGSATFTIGYKTVSVTYPNGQSAVVTAAAVFNALGNSAVPEFAEYTYAYDGNLTITATHNTAGVQAALSGTTTGGTGTTVAVTTTQQAVGPNWISAAGNWSLGLPHAGHDAIIDGGSSVLYGLNAPGFASPPDSVHVTATFTNEIGLPDYRDNAGGGAYFEFRQRYWDITAPVILIGEGTGDGSAGIRIAVPDASTLQVLMTGRPTVTADSAVNVIPKTGRSPTLIALFGGSLSFGVDPLSDVGTTLAALIVNGTNAQFTGGRNQTITTTIVNRGLASAFGTMTTVNAKGGTYRQEAGMLGTVVGTGAAQVVLAHAQGTDVTAQFTGQGQTVPVLDCSENSLARQLGSTSYFKGGAYLLDPAGSTALDAVLFDSASAKASQLGDSYTVTR